MRSKKALMNTVATLMLQLVTVVCGFIVPRLIIGTYGSDVNGLVSSISQFLSYIALFEAGVGGVVRAALYKPLAENDVTKLSAIVNATERFFRKIAYIFVGYAVVLACAYPLLVNKNFDWLFTASLVLIIGVSTFAQYYFGMTYTVFIQADQRKYVTAGLQMLTLILNAVLVVIFARLGASVHLLKLGTSVVYALKPMALNIYVKKKYNLDKTVAPDNTAIRQRWDGLGHHLAFFVNLNTDVFILTIFSKISADFSISEVSVYSVYYAVVNGIVNVTSSISGGMEAALGNMLAKNEDENLREKFAMYEFLSFFVTTFMFTCAAVLVVPFVSVYTRGIHDADYIRPAFAYFLVLAYAVYSLRAPYNNLTLAAGHYRQTRNGAFAEAGINVGVSAVLVYFCGITGVAVGTLAAMLFRTVQYAVYLSRNILKRSIWIFVKRLVVSALASGLSLAAVHFMPAVQVDSYFTWVLLAAEYAAVIGAVTVIINLIFSRREFKATAAYLSRVIFSRLKKSK